VYPSGHGFGHASRDFEVLRAMHQIDPTVQIHLRTTVAEWFVKSGMREVPWTMSCPSLDVGIRQRDSLTQNIDETLASCLDLLSRRETLLDEERAFLRASGADVVLSDIPAIPLAAAAEENIPAVAMSNFTWSWIYDDLSVQTPALRQVSAAFARDYARADLFLRLPFHGGEAVSRIFPRAEDVPMVARHGTHSARHTRRCLGLDEARAVVLVSFGGLGPAHFDWRHLARLQRYLFVVTPPVNAVNDLHESDNLRLLEAAHLAPHGLHYADLVKASDIVVSKPGYGIVSECLANETRLLYTSRGQFAEYDILVAGIERHGVGAFISNEDLMRGHWGPSLDALMARPRTPASLPSDGAAVVARRLFDLAAAHPGKQRATPRR